MKNNETGKEEDLDHSFLDNVLNQLYDFGDGSTSNRNKRSQKKKKVKKCEEEDASNDEDCLTSTDNLHDNQSQEDDRPGTNQMGDSETKNVESTNHQCPPGVKLVVFQDPTKKPTRKRPAAVPTEDLLEANKKVQTKSKQQTSSLEDVDMEKARLEVHRFGLTGYKKEQQRMFEQERAIMLGARPPKKEYVNYKQLQHNIKEKKQKAREEAQNTDLKDKKKKKNKPREEKRKSTPGGSAPSGQLGRFKNGMLLLNSKEIRKIKTSIKGSRK